MICTRLKLKPPQLIQGFFCTFHQPGKPKRLVSADMTEHTETLHCTPPLSCQAWLAASATPMTEFTAETPSAVLALTMFGLEFHSPSLRRIIHQLNTMLAIDVMIEAVLIKLALFKTHVSTILRTREGTSWITKSHSILEFHGWGVSMKSLYWRSTDGRHIQTKSRNGLFAVLTQSSASWPAVRPAAIVTHTTIPLNKCQAAQNARNTKQKQTSTKAPPYSSQEYGSANFEDRNMMSVTMSAVPQAQNTKSFTIAMASNSPRGSWRAKLSQSTRRAKHKKLEPKWLRRNKKWRTWNFIHKN